MGAFAKLLGFEEGQAGQPGRALSPAQITLRSMSTGETYYQVTLCTHQDYSGWAGSREEAIRRALDVADRITCTCQVANEPWPHDPSIRDAIRRPR